MTSAAGRLEGRRIVITGGASGIGAATCRLFAREGARIAVVDRDIAGARAVAETIGAEAFLADVCDAASVQAAVNAAADALGGLDGVVNGAGVAHDHRLAETSVETFRLALNVNLVGPFIVCQAALPHLQRNASATIVNIASIAAMRPTPGRTAYAASKGGLVALTKVLAAELAPTIRVNVVCPGAVDTPMTRADFVTEELLQQARDRHALRRLGEPDDVAAAILFMTGGESSFVTGTTFVIDGGRTYY